MKIKTKYDIGDSVWYMLNNKVHQNKIKSISYDNQDGIEILYELYCDDMEFDESKLFDSKEDLLKSL